MKRSLTLVGVVLVMVGWYSPWVTSTRQLAALTYNALDLTEFVKFVVRAGVGHITREWFLVPIVAAAFALALWASQPGISHVLRYALTLLAAVISLVPLSPYPYLLKVYASVEDRGSFWLSVAGLIGVAIIFVIGPRIMGRWRAAMFMVLALIGAVPAAWEFLNRALPATSTVYGSPAQASWGFVVAMIGFALVAASAVMRET